MTDTMSTEITEPRWYCLSREGLATLCIDEEDAKEVAAESLVLYPQNGPYRAVQMVEVSAVARAVADAVERCAKLCERISDEYQSREGMKYPELKTDAQTGADDCAVAIRRANDREDNTGPMQPHSHGLL